MFFNRDGKGFLVFGIRCVRAEMRCQSRSKMVWKSAGFTPLTRRPGLRWSLQLSESFTTVQINTPLSMSCALPLLLVTLIPLATCVYAIAECEIIMSRYYWNNYWHYFLFSYSLHFICSLWNQCLVHLQQFTHVSVLTFDTHNLLLWNISFHWNKETEINLRWSTKITN